MLNSLDVTIERLFKIRLGNFIVLNWEESKDQMLRGKIKKEVANFMTYK